MSVRIYLTFADVDNKLPWGGLHITLAGKSPENNTNVHKIHKYPIVQLAVGKKNVNHWTFHSNSDITYDKQKNGLYFSSKAIDNIAEILSALGFTNIKGPKFSKNKMPWHITLPDDFSVQKVCDFIKFLKNKQMRPKWYLTIATENSEGSFSWEKIK